MCIRDRGDKIFKELSAVSSWTSTQYTTTGYEDLYAEDDQLIDSESGFTGEEQSSWTLSLNTNNSLFGSLSTGKIQVTSGSKSTTWIKIATWTKLNKTSINVLSGTSLYYGSVESAEKIWLSYQYALKDQKGILYVYLWTGKYSDIDTIIRKLWWTTYKMTTEQELLQNKLFGEKVIFINLPEYKDKKVIMLTYIDSSVWLLQVDYSTYHTSKSHIKKIFTE